MEHNKEYLAFISYKREDEDWAKWLAHELEHYHFPLTLNGRDDLPKDLRPIFRDIDELSAGNLPRQIHQALEKSKNLIIICSPRSANSPWVNKEVEEFISMGKLDRIFPFIIEGIPNAKNEEDECLPKAIRELKDDNERLGANVSEYKDGPLRLCIDCPLPKGSNKKQGNINDKGRDAAVVKIVAGMFGLSFDTLWQRYEREKAEEERKIREQRDKLLIMQSRFLAEKANSLKEEGDSYTARLLALEALPKNLENPDRPYVQEAEIALRNSCRLNSAVFRGHTNWVNAIFVNHSQLISGSRDGTIIIWDIETGEKLKVFTISSQDITAICCDNLIIVVGTREGQIYILNAVTGEIIKSWTSHLLRINSLFLDSEQLISCSNDCKIKIWDIKAGNCLRELSGYYMSYDNYQIVSASNSHIYIWDRKNRECIHDIHLPVLYKPTAISYNGDIIVTGHSNGMIRIWKADSEKPICSIHGHDDEISTIVFGNNILLSGSKDRCIKVWMLDEQKQIKCKSIFEGHTSSISSIIVRGDYFISCSRDNTIRKWDFQNYIGKKNIRLDGDGEKCIVHICNNSIIAGFGDHSNKFLYVWDISTKTHITDLRTGPGNPTAIVHLDNYIICGSFKTIKIWDNKNYSLTRTIKGHNGDITALACIGNYIVSGSWDHVVCLWDLINGNLIRAFIGHTDTIYSLSITNDYIISGSGDNTIRIWDIQTGKCIHILKGHKDRIIAIEQNDEYVFSASWDASIKIWDKRTWKNVYSFKCHTSRITSLVYKFGYLVSGSEDKTVRVWDLGAKDCISVFDTSCFGYVNSVAFDGKVIVAGFYDSKIIATWDYPSLHILIKKTSQQFKNRQLTPEERKKYYLE